MKIQLRTVGLLLGALGLITPEVTSISVSNDHLVAGTSASVTVTVTGLTRAGAALTITSDPAVISLPKSVTIDALDFGRKTFSVFAAAPGCSRISAQVGETAAKSVFVYVSAPKPAGSTPLMLDLLSNEVLGVPGRLVTGKVTLVQITNTGAVQLASSNPAVRVPASMVVPLVYQESGVWVGSATFPITVSQFTAGPSCSVITSTTAGAQSSHLLKIRPMVNG